MAVTPGVAIGNSTAVYEGADSPEGVLTAAIGSIYLRTNGAGGTTLYVKESGAGNTGWVASSTSKFVQSAMDEVTGDVSTASVAFTDLLRVNAGAALSVTLTTGVGFVLVHFNCASSNSLVGTATNDFRLLLDGAPIARSGRGAALSITSEPGSTTIHKRVAVAAGVHTFKVQWKSSTALGSAQIRAASVPDAENAELICEEVTA